jgi:Holliday junction resolvase RusA-like endonuclease
MNLDKSNLKRALSFIDDMEQNNKPQQVEFVIIGNPSHFKRPRVCKNGHTYSPHHFDKLSLQDKIRLSLPKNHIPFNGPCELFVNVYRQIPQSFPAYKTALAELGYIKPTTAPDYDNYIKLISDALNGCAFTDDAKVTLGQVEKFFSIKPRVEIILIGKPNYLYK